MDLVPYLSLISTGTPWLDHLLRASMILFILYSILLNVLIATNPALKDQTWVRVSLAIFSNLAAVFPKKQPDASFPQEAPTIPNRPVRILEPASRTLPSQILPPPDPPTAA